MAAASACQIAGNSYESPHGLYIVICDGDVTQAPADGIVVSEGTRFKDMGYVAATLVTMDSAFDLNRNELIVKEKGVFKPWTTYMTGECATFKWVIHAIVQPRCGKQNMGKWKTNMTSLYKKILLEAENKGISILAVPLLGSGRGNVDTTEAVEVAVHAMFSHKTTRKKRSLVKVLLVSHRKSIVDMLATQCAYLSCVKGGTALEPSQSHTQTERKNGSIFHRPPPQRKLKGETSSNNAHRTKHVLGRSDHSRGSDDTSGMVLRSGRVLSPRSQTDVRLPRSSANTNDTGKTCKRIRDSELKRVNGPVGEEHYKTKANKYYEPKSLQHAHDISGGAKPKVSNMAKNNGPDDDDDNDDDNGGDYYDDDDDDDGGVGDAAVVDDDDDETIRLHDTKVTTCMGVSPAVEFEEAILKNGLNEPVKDSHITGDQMPREDRKRHGCNDQRTADKASDRTGTHSTSNGSGSGKSTNTDHDDLTVPMANLSISHTNGKVTQNKPSAHNCTICLEEISNPKTLDRCGHVFCTDCIDDCFARYKPVCPSCNMVYGVLTGNQPDGTMNVAFSDEHLPGYETCGMITITYHFRNGTQMADHPNPGNFYKGTTRVAYLPDCREGRDVLRLLRKAFDRKLTFTIGRSTTTGRENVVTWNDIHHKTNIEGGPTRFGFPDKTYLIRVKEELASKGVTDGN
ncbi:uncharacterized protein [Haliotis asinina]|uniref:uncharacterized protein n=1 Tax=Haliotis asinina TaxID=109174 RepID=UPI00353278BE